MQVEGKLTAPLFVQFVMGVKNAVPADREVFDFDVKTLNRRAPDAPWCGAGIGANQIRFERPVPTPAQAREILGLQVA